MSSRPTGIRTPSFGPVGSNWVSRSWSRSRSYLAAGLITVLLPEDFPVSLGHINFLISGLVPLLTFLAAVAARLRAFAPFGFRRVDLRWLLLGAGVGFACFLLSWPVSAVFDPFFPGSEGVQQATATPRAPGRCP